MNEVITKEEQEILLKWIFSNEDKLAQDLLQSSKITHDPLWQLPLYTPYKVKFQELSKKGISGADSVRS